MLGMIFAAMVSFFKKGIKTKSRGEIRGSAGRKKVPLVPTNRVAPVRVFRPKKNGRPPVLWETLLK